MKTALLAGATGLVGRQLLQLLLNHNAYVHVKAITRRPLDIHHPKLENLVFDFDDLRKHYEQLKADDVFCCLGTTIKQAGSRQAFKKVDYEYPLEIAKIAKELGASKYFLVSALGASTKSSIFYNQVKGQIEEAVATVGFESYHIFRPSLLLGSRAESRPGEDAAKTFYKIFGKFLPKKYQAIDSGQVAKAILFCAEQAQTGTFIHDSGELQRLGRS